VAILPAVVLAVLIVSDVAGGRWANGFDWQLVLGVGAAATSRLFSMPMLAAVLIGGAVTAGLRVIA
jgi:hypothetical protein